MSTPFECLIDSEIFEKFKIALMLNGEKQDEVIRNLMMQYISSSFFQASQIYKQTEVPQAKSTRAKNVKLAVEVRKLLDEL